MKILIVDDEEIVRRSIARVMAKAQHLVQEAADGKAGLGQWQSFDPDVVFLDVLMPGLTGPEVLKKIGSNHRSKVILMSAYSGEYNMEKAKLLGADIFISKPFDDIFALVELAEGLVGHE